MTNTERLAEALRYYEQALLTAFPYGACGQVFESWNRARKALNAHESAAQARAPAPAQHIKRPYSLSELREKIASHEYGAELLLQHAMLLLDQTHAAPAGEAVPVAWPDVLFVLVKDDNGIDSIGQHREPGARNG